MVCSFFFFFFKQKTAYEMRISDWSSDVCSSDLPRVLRGAVERGREFRDQGLVERVVHFGARQRDARDTLLVDLLHEQREGHQLHPKNAEAGGFGRRVECGSEGRRVGKECVSTCRSRWSRYH